MKKYIFVPEHRFTLQLPYLVNNKFPVAVMITHINAETLVENLKTHTVYHVSGNDYIVTPIKSPEQNIVYQIGGEPL